MQRTAHRRKFRRLFAAAVASALPLCVTGFARAQDASSSPANAPASVPAGAAPALSEKAIAAARVNAALPHAKVSARQEREADDAYLQAAKHLEHLDLAAAEQSLERAVQLNPGKQEYVLSLAVIREYRVTELVQAAAKARLTGDNTKAELLLQQARALDPQNSVVTQHIAMLSPLPIDASMLPGSGTAARLAGPIEFAPTPGRQSVHARGSGQDVMRATYQAFGIRSVFDPSSGGGPQARLDLDNVDFATAARTAAEMTHLFAVPLEPKAALIAKDTQENRDTFEPQVEETIFMPGVSGENMNEMATLARNVFELKKVVASPGTGNMLVAGNESTIQALNETYADILSGGNDVLLEVKLYEIDKTRLRNIGIQTPTSVGAFSVASEALNLINSNQTVIQQAVANGLLTLTGNPAVDYPKELALLIASGLVTSTEFSNLLGTLGTLQGLPLLGVYAGSGATFNLLLNSSDTRTLDDVQMRVGSGQPGNFRAGSRYPVITATYSSGISSALSSQLSGLTVNGTSVSSLLSQYLGSASSSVSIPQVQYEDLGVTLKATPRVLRDGNISMQLDMKIEALAGGTINSIPILNNRQLTSSIIIPQGQTALLASEISRQETRAIAGVPGLSELPGFQGTDKSKEVDTGELLITITPHIVRGSNLRIAGRRIAVEHPHGSQGGGDEDFTPQPEPAPAPPQIQPGTVSPAQPSFGQPINGTLPNGNQQNTSPVRPPQ